MATLYVKACARVFYSPIGSQLYNLFQSIHYNNRFHINQPDATVCIANPFAQLQHLLTNQAVCPLFPNRYLELEPGFLSVFSFTLLKPTRGDVVSGSLYPGFCPRYTPLSEGSSSSQLLIDRSAQVVGLFKAAMDFNNIKDRPKKEMAHRTAEGLFAYVLSPGVFVVFKKR